MPLVILPDTNSLLHFKRPDQVDWLEVAGRADVEIILSALTLREIDKHSQNHPIARTRDRARNLKGWIRSLLISNSGSLTRVDSREPTAFFPDGLDPNIPDDRLLATALMLESEGAEVAVYSDDTVVHAKAGGQRVKTIWPQDADRLKEEPDPTAAENTRLKRELDGIKARQPILSVAWTDHAIVLDLPVFSPDLGDVSTPEAERERLLPMPLAPEPPAARWVSDLARIESNWNTPSAAAIRRFNSDIEEYHRKYVEYYTRLKRYEFKRGRLGILSLTAGNSGTAVATSFRASLVLPAGLKLLEDEDAIGERPKAPKEPRPPKNLSLGLTDMYGDPLGGRTWPSLATPPGSWDDSPYLNLEQNSLELRQAKLPQHQIFKFEPALVLINADLDGKNGAIDFRITAEELPKPQTGSLSFKVSPQ